MRLTVTKIERLAGSALLALLLTVLSASASAQTTAQPGYVQAPVIGQACSINGAQRIDPYNSILTCLPNGNGMQWYLVGSDGIPHCASDEVFNFDGVKLTCAKVQILAPTCLTGQVLTYTGSALECIYLATY